MELTITKPVQNKELTKKDLKLVNEARGLAKFLSIDFTVKIFGIEIISYHFPPQNS